MRSRDGGAGRAGAVALAAVVVATALLLVVGLVVVVVLDSGWSRVVWAALAGLLLWQLLPRPARVSPRAVTLPASEAPALHRLVAEVATAAEARPPTALVVDTVYATTLVRTGYRGPSTLLIGLPQWTALDDDERIALVTHELACAEPARAPAGALIRLADDVLARLLTVLQPAAAVQPYEQARERLDRGLGGVGEGDDLAGDRLRREVAAGVGAAGLSVVAAPVRGLRRALRRAALRADTAHCLVADARAAALVGAPAVVRLLTSTLGVPRGWVAAEVAARRRADPFPAIADAGPPAPEELQRRLAAATGTGERTGARHAPTSERVRALQAGSVDVRGVSRQVVRAADQELDAHRERLARRFAEELVHGRP